MYVLVRHQTILSFIQNCFTFGSYLSTVYHEEVTSIGSGFKNAFTEQISSLEPLRPVIKLRQ